MNLIEHHRNQATFLNQIMFLSQIMLRFQGLENPLETISLVLFVIILVEIGFDFALTRQRDDQETMVKVAIGMIQEGTNFLAANTFGLIRLSLVAFLSVCVLESVVITDSCLDNFANDRVGRF